MKGIWKRIEIWLAANSPQVLQALQPGAMETQIRAAEAAMGVTFPEDVRTSYLIHDGQRPEGFNFLDGYGLLSLDRMVNEWRMWKQLLDEGDLDYESEPQEPIRTDWWNPLWIPLASDGSGNHLCLDLAPAPAGYLGQIISMWHDGPERKLISGSFAAWLERLADDFQEGRYIFAEEYGGLVRRDMTWGYSEDIGWPPKSCGMIW